MQQYRYGVFAVDPVAAIVAAAAVAVAAEAVPATAEKVRRPHPVHLDGLKHVYGAVAFLLDRRHRPHAPLPQPLLKRVHFICDQGQHTVTQR